MTNNCPWKIAVINVKNPQKNSAMNKDLNGGFGTIDSYSTTHYERIISLLKKSYIKLPILSLAYLMGIFKERNIAAQYYEGKLPAAADEPDIILIYGSLIDYKNENAVCRLLKERFARAKVGFIGPCPSTKPDLFASGDFIIIGDFEYFFLKEFQDRSQLTNQVLVNGKISLDELPLLELEGFPINEYSYSPAITKKLFFVLQSTKGCPYSCSYYCVYGNYQGNQISVRSPEKVINDIIYLSNKYNIKGFQFRDPIFGIIPGYIEKLCAGIKKNNLKIHWGIETRLELLDEDKIKIMFNAGLRNINIGIETADPFIAQQNKRLLVKMAEQERLIKYCNKIGVKISAFYLFGYEGETKESMTATLNYAKKLNTFLARFAIFTPYPGTKFFEELEQQGRIETYDYEKYTQFNLVFKHQQLSASEIQKMLATAYKEYYFRLSYILKLLLWKIREFWL